MKVELGQQNREHSQRTLTHLHAFSVYLQMGKVVKNLSEYGQCEREQEKFNNKNNKLCCVVMKKSEKLNFLRLELEKTNSYPCSVSKGRMEFK